MTSIIPDTPSVCPTCDGTGLVAPWTGRGSDGPDPCPHCSPPAPEEPGCGTCEFCRIRDALEADDGA